MVRSKAIKIAMIAGCILTVFLWAGASSLSKSVPSSNPDKPQGVKPADENYVGTETCQLCHEDQFAAFSHTSHAGLAKLSSWKGKVTGCESCHGPGKAHVDGGGDTAKIIRFTNKSSKETAEKCLSCHAGKEERNNFRRGEHWRNDIGCTDCHSPHSSVEGRNLASSNVYVARANAEKPGISTIKMLRLGEPQLCLSCHSEVKPQFSAPFHHKVLEGAMKCSDCHNPHGGFELKQTRRATGGDAPCIKCHADKLGPFTYEHAPVKTEGCTACHIPHGSSNPRLLRYAAVAQLCLTCHSQAHNLGAQEPPGFHNLAGQYADCTACHVKIHGSRTHPFFFR